MKTFHFLLLWSGVLFFSNFQCGDKFPCDENYDNVAALNIEVAPLEKTIALGDTIWLRCDFDTQLELANNNETISIDNTEISLMFQLLHLLPNNEDAVSGFSDFIIYNKKGTVSKATAPFNTAYPYADGAFLFSCNDSNCGLEIGLIPLKQGAFCINLTTEGTCYITGLECPEIAYFSYNTFAVQDFHHEIYDELNIGNNDAVRYKSGDHTYQIQPKNGENAYTFLVQ